MAKKNTVGNNIRRLRTDAKITQEELALRSNLSQGYINQLELGKRNYTQKSLELIAEALSVPVIDFFKGGEEARRPATTKSRPRRRRPIDRKELAALLKDLPEHISEHYLTLMKLERDILRKRSTSIG